MKRLLILYMAIVGSVHVFGQDSTTAKNEQIWPEINVFYKFNSKFRLYGLYSATKLKNSAYTDGGWGIYVDYFALPGLRKKINPNIRDSTRGYLLWLRAGYLYSSTPPESEDPFKENTLVTEANLRFHLPWHLLLTDKNRFDWRSIDGHFEPRYRARLTLEKDMRTEFLYFTPNIYGEYYVYFNNSKLNRFRLSAGIQTKVTKHIEFETYYVYQFAHGQYVKSFQAMGLSLKFYFRHDEVKKRFSKKQT